MDLSLFQKKVVAIIPCFTGSLSLIGSSLIIYMILGSKKKFQNPTRRLVFALSCYDILQSFASLCSVTLSPKNTPGAWGALGNETSCEVQGFLLSLGYIGSPLYNGMLSLNYLLIIRYGLSDIKIRQVVEPFMHAIAVVWPLTVAISCLYLGLIHSDGHFCWINPSPQDCSNDGTDDNCKKAEDAFKEDIKYRWIFFGVVNTFIFILILSCMALVYYTVRRQELSTENKYGHDTISADKSYKNPALFQDIKLKFYRRKSSRSKRTKNVLSQAMAYSSAYFITFFFPSIYILIIENTQLGEKDLFVILILTKVFLPMQGAFNFLVYMRPHVVRFLENHPEYNVLQAFIIVLKTRGEIMTSRRSSYRTQRISSL